MVENDINTLLSNPKVRLVDILLSPALLSEVRSENPKLLYYLQDNTIIIELAEWAFSTKYADNPRFIEVSDKSVSVILSSISFTEVFIENESFAKILHNFLISDDSKDSRLCGHFLRVIGFHIKLDIPLLFISYLDIQELLFNRIDMYSISELIALIISTNPDNFINSEKMIKDLSYSADVNNDKNSVYLLITILKIVIANPNLSYLFKDDKVLNHLLNVAIKTESALIQSDLFTCLSYLQYQPSKLSDQITIEKLTITEKNISDLTTSAIDVLQIPVFNLIPLFFAANATERLHSKILSKIESMNLREFIKVANIPNFITNIINAFGTDRWCPHCAQITMYFYSIQDCCKPLKSKKWRTFVFYKFRPLIKVLDHEYGGHLPSQCGDCEEDFSDGSCDSFEDNENPFFEEEEDFYDGDSFAYEEEGTLIENLDDWDDNGEYDIDM